MPDYQQVQDALLDIRWHHTAELRKISWDQKFSQRESQVCLQQEVQLLATGIFVRGFLLICF